MTNEQKITRLESEGWEYKTDLRLTVEGNTLVQLKEAWTKDGMYKTFKNGRFSSAKKIL